MEKRILFCASTFRHIENFHLPYLEAFRARGYQVWVAAGGEGELPQADRCISLPLRKRFFSLQNLRAVWRLRGLLKETEISMISTHTTLANAVVRLAVLTFGKKKRPRVAVTCHGFLFHETDGLKKWAYLLPEKICAPVTDLLMVMNREDLEIARRHRLSRDIRLTGGMGVPAGRFGPVSPQARGEVREKWGFGAGEILFVYAAEFSPRKDHASLIRAFAKAAANMPEANLLLAGEGALLEDCRRLAQSLAPGRVRFLGYVNRMEEVYPCCDVSVASSRIEGMPFHVMEAMLCGLPVIARDTKGHRDLIEGRDSGILYRDEAELVQALERLYRDETLRKALSAGARRTAAQYTLDRVLPQVMELYEAIDPEPAARREALPSG